MSADLDALIENCRRIAAIGGIAMDHRDYTVMADALTALIAEVRELRQDAERYRWLRENICIGSGAGGFDRWSVDLPDPGIALSTDGVFDAAIDAALAQGGK